MKSETTRKNDPEFTDQQPLLREWSNTVIGRQEHPQKVISSASSNSLGSYSLGKQPARVLQPIVIGKDDLNSTF